MKDKELEEKINNLLKENAFGWIEDLKTQGNKDRILFLLSYMPSKPKITYQSAGHLSVKYTFYQVDFLEKVVCPEYYLCLTIDMRLGERVLLKDLLKMDMDLAERIKQPGAVLFLVPDLAETLEDTKKSFMERENGDILGSLEFLSADDMLSERGYIMEWGDGNINVMLDKTSYNLTPKGIEVNRIFGGRYVTINKDYLKDFLYIDPWK